MPAEAAGIYSRVIFSASHFENEEYLQWTKMGCCMQKLSDKGHTPVAAAKAAETEEDPELVEPKKVGVLDAGLGAVQALAISAVLYVCATQLDAFMFGRELPTQYTARNMAITVRSVIQGLVYLATFIFAANGLGLAALTIKIAAFGDDEEAVNVATKTRVQDNLPKVGLTSSVEDVMKAFDEVSKVDRYKVSKDGGEEAKK
jgi:hypothetical protein